MWEPGIRFRVSTKMAIFGYTLHTNITLTIDTTRKYKPFSVIIQLTTYNGVHILQ